MVHFPMLIQNPFVRLANTISQFGAGEKLTELNINKILCGSTRHIESSTGHLKNDKKNGIYFTRFLCMAIT